MTLTTQNKSSKANKTLLVFFFSNHFQEICYDFIPALKNISSDTIYMSFRIDNSHAAATVAITAATE